MTRHQSEAVACQRRRAGIAVVMLMIGSLGVLGCGKPQPAGAAARQPRPAQPARPTSRPVEAVPPPAPSPAPAVVERPAPIEPDPEPVIVEEPEPVRVVETAPEVPAIVEQAEPVALEPDEPVDYLALAEAAADAGDCRMALEHMRRVRVDEPDDLMLRLREAMLCNDCRQPRQALELLLDLDARTRATEPFAAEIAEAFLGINEPGKAAMAWELRYIIEPSAWDAAAQAAIAWLEAGVNRPANWWYERARAAAPDSPEVQMLATVIESARGSDR